MNDGMNAMVLLRDPIPATITELEWGDQFTALCTIEELVPWAIGRFLLHGRTYFWESNQEWAGKKEEIATQTGKSLSRIENILVVARLWPDGPPVEYEGLSFGHFEAVTRFRDSDELMHYWLYMAKSEGWTVGRLQDEIKGDRETQKYQAQDLARHLASGSWTVAATSGGWVRLRSGGTEIDCRVVEWRVTT